MARARAWRDGYLVRVGPKVCGSCGRKKDIETDFGYRMMADEKRVQGWCKACRVNHKRELKRRARK